MIIQINDFDLWAFVYYVGANKISGLRNKCTSWLTLCTSLIYHTYIFEE